MEGLNQESRATRYRAEAALARSEAALAEDETVVAMLLEIARLFDAVADRITRDEPLDRMAG